MSETVCVCNNPNVMPRHEMGTTITRLTNLAVRLEESLQHLNDVIHDLNILHCRCSDPLHLPEAHCEVCMVPYPCETLRIVHGE